VASPCGRNEPGWNATDANGIEIAGVVYRKYARKAYAEALADVINSNGRCIRQRTDSSVRARSRAEVVATEGRKTREVLRSAPKGVSGRFAGVVRESTGGESGAYSAQQFGHAHGGREECVCGGCGGHGFVVRFAFAVVGIGGCGDRESFYWSFCLLVTSPRRHSGAAWRRDLRRRSSGNE